MKKEKARKICTGFAMGHSEARLVIRQLKTNPEVCEGCKISPCTLVKYVYGENKQIKLVFPSRIG